MATTETGTGMSAAGGASINPYEEIGPTIQTYGYGWGTYEWGKEAWGEPRSTSNVTIEGRNWSFDNFGEDLLATASNPADLPMPYILTTWLKILGSLFLSIALPTLDIVNKASFSGLVFLVM